MKKLLSILLCFVLLSANAVLVSAEGEADVDVTAEEIYPLSQLGVLDTTEPEAIVTKNTLVNGLNTIIGNGAGAKYFEGHDLEMPLLYGQAVMTLIDAMGYTPYMEMKRYDTSDPADYIMLAGEIDLIGNRMYTPDKQLTVNEYAKLLYTALTEVPLMRISGTDGLNLEYEFKEDVTLLTKYMHLIRVEGIVSGVNGVSTSPNDGKKNNSIKIDGAWYQHSIEADMFDLFGKYCEVYVNEESGDLKCVNAVNSENQIIAMSSDDIVSASEGLNYVSYTKENKGKSQKLSISKEVDVIYNRELLTAPSKADLIQKNTDLTFIDNNNDDEYDVIIISKYKSYVVYSVSADVNRILDTYGNIYDLTEFFDSGYKFYGVYGKPIEMNTPVRYNVVSYLEAKSGEITYMKLSDNKIVGIVDKSEDNFRYVTIEGVRYECTQDYLDEKNRRDKISVGDRVNAFADCNGRIVDIKFVSGNKKAAYILSAGEAAGGEVAALHMLDEDGKVKTLYTGYSVTLNGSKVSGDSILKKDVFKKDGAFKPQLILYKANSENQIITIETAAEIKKIGSRNNRGFTLDYDWEVNGTPRAVVLNNELVVASKYIASMNVTTVFGVVHNSKEDCYVQQGSAFNNGAVLPVSTDLKVKIYNVNDNYEAQYIVYEQSIDEGGWVDYWGDPHILDDISYALNEDDEVVLKIRTYSPKGKVYEKYVENPNLKTQQYNALSGDTRLYDVELKDLPKGTVMFINEDFGGVRSIAVQHMPRKDNQELIFEDITGGSTSTDYGINERTYNGKYLMSYGEVVARIEAGIVVNNHMPTEDEAAEGAVFPMQEWNRVVPLASSDVVFLYDKSADVLTMESADCILPGDMIFTKRSGETYNGVYVYRD